MLMLLAAPLIGSFQDDSTATSRTTHMLSTTLDSMQVPLTSCRMLPQNRFLVKGTTMWTWNLINQSRCTLHFKTQPSLIRTWNLVTVFMERSYLTINWSSSLKMKTTFLQIALLGKKMYLVAAKVLQVGAMIAGKVETSLRLILMARTVPMTTTKKKTALIMTTRDQSMIKSSVWVHLSTTSMPTAPLKTTQAKTTSLPNISKAVMNSQTTTTWTKANLILKKIDWALTTMMLIERKMKEMNQTETSRSGPCKQQKSKSQGIQNAE